MKYILISFSLLFVSAVYATESKDLAQLLKESRCVPTRNKKGVVSYKCDGTLGAELEAQRNTRYQKPLTSTTARMQTFARRKPASLSSPGSSPQTHEK